MMYLGVDPGLSAFGVALIDDNGDLVAADRIEIPARDRTVESYMHGARKVYDFVSLHVGVGVDLKVLFEQMEVRKRDHTIDDNDLLSLAYLSGAVLPYLTQVGAQVTMATPFKWKGNVPKSVMQKRLDRDYPDLDFKDRWGHKAHDVYDALGMAQYAFKNL